MNDLAEGDLHCGDRVATVAISCSCFIPDLHRILLSTLISLCWGVGRGSLIASLMGGCGVVMREAHFIFYWGDEIQWLHRLQYTLLHNMESKTSRVWTSIVRNNFTAFSGMRLDMENFKVYFHAFSS